MVLLPIFMLKGIIYDFMRTLYDPEKGQLFGGVLPMLISFKEKGLKQGLISFGGAEKKRLIEGLGLGKILDWYKVVEEKNPEVFESFIKEFNLRPEETLVVGDLVNQEIAVGSAIGAKTVWVKWGAFADVETLITPDFMIDNISKLRDVIANIGQI